MRRLVSRQAKRTTREPECNAGEWIGQAVDGPLASATFADESQGLAQKEKRLGASLTALRTREANCNEHVAVVDIKRAQNPLALNSNSG